MANDTDQLTFQNPVTRYPSITPPRQDQPEPGLDRDLEPQTDRGEDSYRGTGRLEGRRALITGGDSGLGAAIAIAFAREGADVALNYLPVEQPDADEVKRVIEATGRAVHLFPGDLTDPQFCADLVTDAADALGGLDAVVVNASGCGTLVKDYGHLLKDDPAYAKPAARIAACFSPMPLSDAAFSRCIACVRLARSV